jgi:hypothetical protein
VPLKGIVGRRGGVEEEYGRMQIHIIFLSLHEPEKKKKPHQVCIYKEK